MRDACPFIPGNGGTWMWHGGGCRHARRGATVGAMNNDTQQAVIAALAGLAPPRPRPQATPGQRALIAALTLVQGLALGGCAWLSLSWGAFSYPTTQSGQAANVAVHGDWAYVTRGTTGYEVLRAARNTKSHVFMPPPGLGSVDDVAVADGLLFLLDAQAPGHLRVLSLADPSAPSLIGAPVEVAVGPFSGVTASGGRVIVSGGTSPLTLRTYDAGGRLGAVALDTYGFTPGGARPASFPIEAAVEGSLLYVASAAGLEIVDVTDAHAPRPIAQFDPGVMPVNVDVRNGIAAVVGSVPAPQLVFVSVRDPAHPKVLRSYPLPEGSLATGVALTDTYAVVAAHGRGAQLFDRAAGAWQHFTRPFPHLTPGLPSHEVS